MLESESFGEKTSSSQPFYSTSASIFRQNLFSPAISHSRRAHAISKGPGNDWTSDQKLVSKP